MAESARAQVRYGAFQLYSECQHCGEQLPVNGPLRRLPCGACGGENRIDLDVITALLSWFEERGQAEGEARAGRLTPEDAGRAFSWRYTPGTPRCQGCGAELWLEASGGGSVACEGCGAVTPVVPVPAWLKITVPSAVWVIGGQPAAGSGSGVAPIALDCPGCGRGLTLEGMHARITPCGYCGQEIFLSELVWARLHPPQTVRDWYVQFEGPTAEQLRRTAAIQSASREREHRRRARGAAELRAGLRLRWVLFLLSISGLLLAIAAYLR